MAEETTYGNVSASNATYTSSSMTLDEAEKTGYESKQEESKAVEAEPDEITKFYAKLNETANEKSRRFFEHLTTIDEYSFAGRTYKYKMVKRKDMGELRRLLTEAATLAEGKDFEGYAENICKRACILIEGMTPEKFEEDDYDLVENIVGAWSIKWRGFRDYQQGV